MQENRINALAEFLKVVPEKIRGAGAKHRHKFHINDQGERIEGRLDSPLGSFDLRIDFDPEVFSIVDAHCSCPRARRGNICEHLCGLASQLVDVHLSADQNQHSLEFLDKHFNAPGFQSAQFRLSLELTETAESLEPEILFHKYIKEGTFGVGRKFTANDSYKFTHGDPADQPVLDYVRHFRQIFFYSNYEAAQRYPWGFWLTLLGHPRVSIDDRRVEVLAAEANLELRPEDDGYILCISYNGESSRPGDLKYFQVEGGIVGYSREEDSLYVCQAGKVSSDIMMEVHQYQPVLSRTELLTNLPRLEKLQTLFNFKLPSELAGVIQKVPPELVLILDLEIGKGFTIAPKIRYKDTAGRITPGSHGQYLSADPQTVIERDHEAEMELYQSFLDLFPYEEEPDKSLEIHVNDLERALVLVEWLKSQKHWALEWLREEPKIHKGLSVGGLRVHIDGKAWLKIHLMADDLTFSLPYFPSEDKHLTATRYVAVGNGEWLEIDQHLRHRLNQFKMAVVQEEQAMKLKNAAMAVLAELDDVAWEGDKNWLKRIKEWQGQGDDQYSPKKAVKATLRNYQLEGYRWLRRLSELDIGACLADDMGLGKTIQALAILLDRLEEGPVLVVSPASVCFNWVSEIERFTPDLNPILYAEGRRTRSLSRLKKGDIVILSYALVLKDIKKLKEISWGTLILDEAQFIKNALSQTAIAVSQLSRKWTLALTGTPLENHLGELWSIFRMLNPELLGPWEQFRKTYMIPIERDQDNQKLESLRQLIQPFILRRTKQKVLADLPDRSDILLKVEMSDAQKVKYEQERKRILSQLDESDESLRFKLLAGITRLRQMACHPVLCEEKFKGESAKLKLFAELIEELMNESHTVLVFSQFTSFLAIIARELNRLHLPHLMMTGETPVKHRKAIIKKFQNGEIPIFLVSLRAGGTGLNLTSANYVIHMDPWWNPAVEEQATDRAHRIGQTQAVTVYRLVAGDTIEESIIDIHDRKRDLVAGILEGKDKVGKLSIQDLISLIKGE